MRKIHIYSLVEFVRTTFRSTMPTMYGATPGPPALGSSGGGDRRALAAGLAAVLLATVCLTAQQLLLSGGGQSKLSAGASFLATPVSLAVSEKSPAEYRTKAGNPRKRRQVPDAWTVGTDTVSVRCCGLGGEKIMMTSGSQAYGVRLNTRTSLQWL